MRSIQWKLVYGWVVIFMWMVWFCFLPRPNLMFLAVIKQKAWQRVPRLYLSAMDNTQKKGVSHSKAEGSSAQHRSHSPNNDSYEAGYLGDRVSWVSWDNYYKFKYRKFHTFTVTLINPRTYKQTHTPTVVQVGGVGGRNSPPPLSFRWI